MNGAVLVPIATVGNLMATAPFRLAPTARFRPASGNTRGLRPTKSSSPEGPIHHTA